MIGRGRADRKRDRKRADRKRAEAAVGAARAAEREARELERSLPPSPGRRRLAAAIADARAARSAARSRIRSEPAAAARGASRATARLQRATRGLAPGGEASSARRSRGARMRTGSTTPVSAGGAAQRAKARAKTIKARRKQAAQVQGWSKKLAAMVLAQAVLTPTDAEAKGGRRSSRNREAPTRRRP